MFPFEDQMEGAYFQFPIENISSIPDDDEAVAVVSVVGSSNFGDACDKTIPISYFLGQKISRCSLPGSLNVDESLVRVEGWYDRSRRIIFLHVIGLHDEAFHDLPAVQSLFEKEDPMIANSILEQQFLRVLVFVFSVSHIVVWNQTSHLFDTSLITLFRSIKHVRNKAKPYLSKLLDSFARVEPDWINTCRLCSPRLLVVMSTALMNAVALADEYNSTIDDEDEQLTVDAVYKQVERSLEEQLYRLFRRSWTITNNTADSVLALPNSQHYVYLLEPEQLTVPPENRASDLLNLLCSDQYQGVNAHERSLQECGLNSLDNVCLLEDGSGVNVLGRKRKRKPALDILASHLLNKDISDIRSNAEHRFSSFLMQHVNKVHSSGFDDNVGRTSATSVFVVPTTSSWFAIARTLYPLIVSPESVPECPPELCKVLTVESPLLRLHRESCKAAAARALQRYKEEPPEYFSIEIHYEMMKRFLLHYDCSTTSGPFYEKYRMWLRNKCLTHWLSDRQGCQQLSLTGHVCQLGKLRHPLKPSEDGDDTAQAPSYLAHKYTAKFRKCCSCGLLSSEMIDSDSLRWLNRGYYEQLAACCCLRKLHYQFPSRETGHEMVVVEGNDLDGLFLSENSSVDRPVAEDGKFNEISIDDDLEDNSQNSDKEDAESFKLHGDIMNLDELNNTALKKGPFAQGSLEEHNPTEGVDKHEYRNPHVTSKSESIEIDICEEETGHSEASYEEEDMREGDAGVHINSNPQELHDSNESLHDSMSRLHIEEPIPVMVEQAYNDSDPNESDDSEMSAFLGNEEEVLNKVDNKYEQVFQVEPMLCSSSDHGFLPSFSSWDLVCLGSSSIYSHSIGIVDQPGFISGSSILLPWDLKVCASDKTTWTPVDSDSMSKRYSTRFIPGQEADGEFFVKLFIGMEYECLRGHRFFMTSPTNKMNSRSIIASANEVTNSAMPLYVKCACSQSEGKAYIAQLLRIHVITPKAPVRVILNPQVQPAPLPCPIYFPVPPTAPLIRLTSAAYWVLRLPNVYVNEGSPYLPPDPTQHVGVENGCLLPNCFSLVDPVFDESGVEQLICKI